MTLELTENELRAIDALLGCNPCRSSCAYKEMQSDTKDCCNCPLTDAIFSIEEKLIKLNANSKTTP
jgi:hypothetical protein